MCNITEFKAQHRWLRHHPEARQSLNFKRLPHHTTMLGRSLFGQIPFTPHRTQYNTNASPSE